MKKILFLILIITMFSSAVVFAIASQTFEVTAKQDVVYDIVGSMNSNFVQRTSGTIETGLDISQEDITVYFSIIVSSAGSGRNKSFDLTISATPFIYFTNDTQYSTSDPSIEVTYLKSGSFSTGNWFEDFLIQLRNRFGGNSLYSNDEMARFSVSWEHDDTLPVNKRNECYSATVTLEYTAV